jgi:hypothetical protein
MTNGFYLRLDETWGSGQRSRAEMSSSLNCFNQPIRLGSIRSSAVRGCHSRHSMIHAGVPEQAARLLDKAVDSLTDTALKLVPARVVHDMARWAADVTTPILLTVSRSHPPGMEQPPMARLARRSLPSARHGAAMAASELPAYAQCCFCFRCLLTLQPLRLFPGCRAALLARVRADRSQLLGSVPWMEFSAPTSSVAVSEDGRG